MSWGLLMLLAVQQKAAVPEAQVEGNGIVVQGSSALPDRAVLTVEIFRQEASPGNELAREIVEVKSGRFKQEFRLFAGAVPPARFVVRVSFDLQSQGPIVVAKEIKKAGLEADFAWTHELLVGSREEQLDAFRAACKRLEGQIDGIIADMEGFFSAMVDPPADWKKQYESAHEAIAKRIQAAYSDVEYRVYFLDGISRGDLPGLGHSAELALQLRAQAEKNGPVSEALKAALRARQYAQLLREKVTPVGLKKSELEQMADRILKIARDPRADLNDTQPIFIELTNALGGRAYHLISQANADLQQLAGAREDAAILKHLQETLAEILKTGE